MSNILKKIQSTVMDNQSRVAIGGDYPTTFSKLWSQTDAFAGGLQDREITAGDTVVIRLSNPRAFLIAFFGTLRNGCVPVTVPAEFDKADIVSVLNETDGSAYVTDETPFLSILTRADAVHLAITTDCDARMGVDLETFLDNGGMNSAGSRTGIDVVRQSDSDRGLIAYVGYDSGEPLGVTYTHAALTAAADCGGSLLETEGTLDHLGSRPLSKPIELLYGVTGTILDGGTYHPHSEWDPETIHSLLYTDGDSRTFVTPEQYEQLRSFETSVGDTLAMVEPPSVDQSAAETNDSVTRLRGCPETGLTHASRGTDIDSDRLGKPLPGVETRVLPGVETRVLDDETDGELVVSGPATMNGYISRPELTDEWITTRDETRWIRTGVAADNAPRRAGGSCADDPMESIHDRSHS